VRAPEILPVFAAAMRAWWEDDALRLGASLAYYTLFAIAPVRLVATAIAGMVFGAEAVRGEIVEQFDQLIGREGGLARAGPARGSRQRRAGILASVVGSITLVIAAAGWFLYDYSIRLGMSSARWLALNSMMRKSASPSL
jgi:membrane protein